MNPKRILIGGGAYGGFNKGDDAILISMLHYLKKLYPKSTFYVMVRNPKIVEGIKNVITCTTKRYKIWYYMLKIDMFICGGGNIFQETGNVFKGFPSTQIWLLILSKILCKKTVVFSAGVEEINSAYNRFMLRFILNRVDILSVRDEGSRKLLEKLNITKEVKVIKDPGFYLNANYNSAKKIIDSIGFKPYEFLAINLLEERKGISKSYKKEISELVDRLIRNGYKILFIPTDVRENKDKKCIDDVLLSFKSNEDLKILNTQNLCPETICAVIGLSNGILSMRMHPMIFAVSQGVSIIPIIWKSNRNKMENFSKNYSNVSFYAEKLDDEELYNAILTMNGESKGKINHKGSYLRILEKELLN